VGSNTLQTSINAVQSQLGFWVPTIGTNFEPALSAANMVQQVMTSPPFRFPWNRNKLTFNTIASPLTQDYQQNVTDFGYMETATFQAPAAGKILTLNVKNTTPIGESSDVQQPVTLAVQLHNVGVSVTFRFLGVPDKIYSVIVTYQKFAPLMSDPTANWIIPDYMSYIYNRGLLAHLYEARGDQRAQQEKVAFAAALLSTSEGLTETEKNIFLAQYLTNPREMELLQLKTQQGVQARAV
jgi:hypothetical protein